METFLAWVPSASLLDWSHLTIPRKGMETNEDQEAVTQYLEVALNYSPQGDGNYLIVFSGIVED